MLKGPGGLSMLGRLEGIASSRRQVRRVVWLLSIAILILAASTAVLLPILYPSAAIGEVGSGPVAAPAETLRPATASDSIYDQFLSEFKPLGRNPERRRYLIRQVLAAADEHQVDPDLLFALIATESRFDSKAVSAKGARGLGQMMFRTARSVAPKKVRRPEDLHSIPRNLYATALHVRQLMDEENGDLRTTLRMYYGGPGFRNRKGSDVDRYVGRVSTYYAYLKARRAHRQISPVAAVKTGRRGIGLLGFFGQ